MKIIHTSVLLINTSTGLSNGPTAPAYFESSLYSTSTVIALVEVPRGSASARIGVNQPMVIEHLRLVGEYLNWHGCLMLDYIFDSELQRPFYIEANPRPGETMNATLSGINIVKSLIELSFNEIPKNSE